MTNIWRCPHIEEVHDDPDALIEQRQMLINVISNHINDMATAEEVEGHKRRVRAAKNESLKKLARKPNRKQDERILPGVNIVNLSGNLSITLCNDCYLAVREDVVIKILESVL